MVKRTLIIVSLLIYIITGKAQTKEFIPEWNFGIGIGPTFSTLSMVENHTSNSIDNKNIQGMQFGVSARYITEKNLGVIAELNYSQQGWEEKFEDGIDSKYKHKLNYIELPILTHIYFGDNTRFFVNLGPKFSYLLSESEEMDNVVGNGTMDDEGNIIENQYGRKANRKFDYGIMAGLGMEIKTKAGNFSLEGRYSFGLGDIFSSSNTDTFSRSANRVISARLTYYTKLF